MTDETIDKINNIKDIKTSLNQICRLMAQRNQEYDRIFDGNFAELFSAIENIIEILVKFKEDIAKLNGLIQASLSGGLEEAVERLNEKMVKKQAVTAPSDMYT